MIYRKTWRHEVIFEAENDEEAQCKWEEISLGKLDESVVKKEILAHDFVENSSFEDEDYNDVKNEQLHT